QGSDVTVHYQTNDINATAGTDYVAVPNTLLTIPAGQVFKTVSVTVKGDVATENNEAFSVILSSPTGTTIADNTGVGTIRDDDAPTLAIGDVSGTEGEDRKSTRL